MSCGGPVVVLWWSWGGPVVVLWWSWGGPGVVLWWSCGGPVRIYRTVLTWLTTPGPPQDIGNPYEYRTEY